MARNPHSRTLILISALAATLLLTACAAEATPELAPTEIAPTHSPAPTPDPIVDIGAMKGAMGTVETDADGVLRYTAVEGDVGGLVCERFGRAYWQLESNLTSGGFSCNSVIYVGEILTPTNDKNP
ncbi:hypothetical protein [Cryobacterium sp. N19]|uniref:hypothetical protein n=1 Tax=Cryobacterium sp. N19 TaxID=2048288 RepID=UPI000CE49947|nr:hypothetical protein [Cryobacterium sp. N19]